MCESKGKLQDLEREKVNALLQVLQKPEENVELVQFLVLLSNCVIFKSFSRNDIIERLRNITVVKQVAEHIAECDDCKKMLEMVALPAPYGHNYYHMKQVFESGWLLVSVVAEFLKLPIPQFPPLIQQDYDELLPDLEELRETPTHIAG